MPGANYMGGRRNAMKARAKDTVGRQQKGHFGRQRLDILSKGISATKPSETGRAGLVVSTLSISSASDINLAHARKKNPLEDTVTTSVHSFIPSPIHITPRTPNSHMRARMRPCESHIPSPEVRRSKVLDAVDLSESLFLRRIADQILAMPNLACLPDRNSTKTTSSSKVTKKVADKATSTPIRSRKRKLSTSDSDEPDPRRKLNISAKPTLREYTIHSSQGPHTPPQKKQQYSKTSNSKTSSRPSHYQWCSSFLHEMSSSSSIFTEREQYHHSIENSGFDSNGDSEGIEATLRSSSLWSPDNRQYSSRTSVDDDFFLQNHTSSIMEDDTYTSRAIQDSSSPTIHENISQVSIQQVSVGDLCRLYLPSAIVLGPDVQQRIGRKDSTFHPTERQTIYGSLFESEDPWGAIGIILGLPERDNKMELPKYRSVDQEVSASETDQAQLSNPQEGDVVVIDGFEVEKGDTDEDETEAEDDEAVEIDCEWEVQSPTVPIHKRVPDDGLETYDNFSVPELPFRDIAVDAGCASSVHDGEDDRMDANRGVSEEVEMDIRDTPQAGNSAEKSTHVNTAKASTSITDFEAPEKMPRPIPIVPDSVEEHVDDSGSDHGGSAAGAAGDKILGTPELREVDGRFLGPSLFADFYESDDE